MSNAMMRLRLVACLCFLSAPLTPSFYAQRDRREPLTEAQQDQIAEAGIDPDARIGLYTKFANEHAQVIESIGKRTEKGRGRRLDSELQDFAAIIDELASNLDEFGGRKADIRKALKGLNGDVPRWQAIVKGLPKDPVSEIAQNDASEALGDLANDLKQLTSDQDTYFKEHKDASGQDREEPQ